MPFLSLRFLWATDSTAEGAQPHHSNRVKSLSARGRLWAAGQDHPEVMEQLKQLGELHEQNVLSDEELEREKAKLLGSD
jgi:hypothetical protein